VTSNWKAVVVLVNVYVLFPEEKELPSDSVLEPEKPVIEISDDVSTRLVPIMRLFVPVNAVPDIERRLPAPAIVTAPVDWSIDPKVNAIVP
jgi:hypothetical protein